MKPFRRLLLLFCILLIPLGGVRLWLLSYRVSDPALAKRIYDETSQRVQKLDSDAGDQARNGWFALQTELGPTRAQTLATLSDNFESPRQGPELKRALADLESMLPRLEAVTRKPVLAWPPIDWTQGGNNNLAPHFIELKRLMEGVHVETRALIQAGKPRDAFRVASLGYTLAKSLNGHGPLIRGMIGLSLERTSLSALNLALLEKLEPEDYEAVSKLVPRGEPGQLLEAYDEEYAWGMDVYAWCQKNRKYDALVSLSPSYLWLCYVPGYVDRERKVAQELYLLARPSVESATQDPNLTQKLEARTPYLSIPSGGNNVDNVVLQYRANWTRREGVRALAALQLYRVRQGHYPDSLDKLSPVPKDWLAPDGRLHYERTKDGIVLDCAHATLKTQGLRFAPTHAYH